MLDRGDVEAYRRDGHVVIRSLFAPAEILALRDALVPPALDAPFIPLSRPRSFLERELPAVHDFIFQPRMGAIASTLLGSARARLIHDVLFEKASGVKPTPWHRDSDFWNFSGGDALTMWIPLQSTPREMALRYVPRSHTHRHRGLMRSYQKATVDLRFAVTSSTLELGDVAIHHHATLHGSGRYTSPHIRRAFAVHVIADGATWLAPTSQFQRDHNRRCGWDRLTPGDAFTDDVAPLLEGGAGASRSGRT